MVDVVDIKVGYSCNNDCFHCVIADKRRTLLKEEKSVDRSTKEVFALIDEAASDGATSIVLTGGEITIRRDIFEILDHVKSKNFHHINMQTNGRMFYYKEFVERIIQYPNVHFTVALHSIYEKDHDWITGSKVSFKQTTQGIKNMKVAGVNNRIGAKFVLSKKNFNIMPDMIKFTKELGCGSINIAFPHAMGNALLNFYNCIPKYSEIHESLTKAINVSKEIKQHVDFAAIPLCYLQENEAYASEFRMSDHTKLRDLSHSDENYTKTRKTTAKLKGPQCKECKYFLICEGPWDDYVHGYGFEDLVPVKGKQITNINELPSFKERAINGY